MKSIVEIINIGDELLIGQVVNTNASWLATQLNKAGFNVSRITIIPDNNEQILEALAEAGARANIILITGGLEPTKDDITKKALCEFFNTSLVFDEPSYKNVEEIFSYYGLKVTEVNRKQAEIPQKCTPIRNESGTAPGMWFEKNRKIFVSMPGIPMEMKLMTKKFIIPELKKIFITEAIVHKTVLTQGVGESSLAKFIEDWENDLPMHIKLAYLPQPGIVRLRLTAVGKQKSKLAKDIKNLFSELHKIIPDLIYGYEDDKLEIIVGDLLKGKEKTLSTAESCTGGYIAHLLTSIQGSSNFFIGSVVAYSNEIKENVLGVKQETLIKHGTVSEQTVTEMAQGVQKSTGSDYAIAVSGIAGPDGGTTEKPVGTTWIAVLTPEKTLAKRFLFGKNRERNIRKNR